MKKISTVGAKQSRNFREQKLMIDLDLGDRSSWYCVLDEAEEVLLREKVDLGPHERYQLVWRRSEQLFERPSKPPRSHIFSSDGKWHFVEEPFANQFEDRRRLSPTDYSLIGDFPLRLLHAVKIASAPSLPSFNLIQLAKCELISAKD